jgi:hypothetical protein
MQVTDEAVHRLTAALRERDARVADLERQLHDLRERTREPAIGALHGLDEPNGVPLRKEIVADEPAQKEDHQ